MFYQIFQPVLSLSQPLIENRCFGLVLPTVKHTFSWERQASKLNEIILKPDACWLIVLMFYASHFWVSLGC